MKLQAATNNRTLTPTHTCHSKRSCFQMAVLQLSRGPNLLQSSHRLFVPLCLQNNTIMDKNELPGYAHTIQLTSAEELQVAHLFPDLQLEDLLKDLLPQRLLDDSHPLQFLTIQPQQCPSWREEDKYLFSVKVVFLFKTHSIVYDVISLLTLQDQYVACNRMQEWWRPFWVPRLLLYNDYGWCLLLTSTFIQAVVVCQSRLKKSVSHCPNLQCHPFRTRCRDRPVLTAIKLLI